MLSRDDREKLQRFHAIHFRGQPIPEIHTNDQVDPQPAQEADQDDLGYYVDGVRRTLTGEQITLFRHSEIQRLLQQRKQTQEKEDDNKARAARKANRATHRTAERSFEDDTIHQQGVETLTYDDEEETSTIKHGKADEKVFLWPQLGT